MLSRRGLRHRRLPAIGVSGVLRVGRAECRRAKVPTREVRRARGRPVEVRGM